MSEVNVANKGQLSILKQGVDVWNKWRKEHPDIRIDLKGADLKHAMLDDANFFGADLSDARLEEAKLCRADFSEANLDETHLNGADLSEAILYVADPYKTDLTRANLTLTNLVGANLIHTIIDQAKISGSLIYSINVWDLVGKFEEQKDLIITPDTKSAIAVDNIEVAQFIYLLLNNQKIRNIIDTVTTKTVLILGQFTTERKQILDALRDELRKRGFIPILFDFQPSPQRDLTETIQLLANMAKFIIADITEAKSIPQELSHIIPLLPSVPVQPILLMSNQEYGMFEHWQHFNSVLPEYRYQDKQDLIDNLETKVILPVNAWRKDQNKVSVLEEKIRVLEAQLSQNGRI